MRVRNRLLADIHQEMVLSRESRDDMREFIRETTIRMDRMFSDLSTVMRHQSAVLQEQGVALRGQTAALRELTSEVREGRAEQRAQTEALIRLIDRMDRLDPGGASA
jgi:hypothetical protein